jgi:hypothetical protein
MSLNKKGSWETISKWVFALVVIIILWVLFINLGDYLYGTGSKAACQNWVYRNSVSYIKELTGNLQSSPCVTTEETIKNIKDKDEFYERLARNMYDCWDQYGQGESDFYSDIDWGPHNLYCRICSEIKFDDTFKKTFKEIDIDDFEIYLNEHNPPNHKETYADFFAKAENSKLDFGSGKISLDQNIYAMFTAYKTGDYSFMGLTNKLLITPGLLFLGGAQIPGTGKITKGIGGLVNYDKTAVRAVTKTSSLVSETGKPLTYLENVVTKTPVKGGLGWGLAILYVGITGAEFLSDGSILNPTLMLIPSEGPQIAQCDAGLYYNPEKKPFDFSK